MYGMCIYIYICKNDSYVYIPALSPICRSSVQQHHLNFVRQGVVFTLYLYFPPLLSHETRSFGTYPDIMLLVCVSHYYPHYGCCSLWVSHCLKDPTLLPQQDPTLLPHYGKMNSYNDDSNHTQQKKKTLHQTHTFTHLPIHIPEYTYANDGGLS